MSKQDIEKRLGFAAQGVKETTRTNAKAAFASPKYRAFVYRGSPSNNVLVKATEFMDSASAAEDAAKQIVMSFRGKPGYPSNNYFADIAQETPEGAKTVKNNIRFSRPGVKAKMGLEMNMLDFRHKFFTAFGTAIRDAKSNPNTAEAQSDEAVLRESWASMFAQGYSDAISDLNGLSATMKSKTSVGQMRKAASDAMETYRQAKAAVRASRPGVKAKFADAALERIRKNAAISDKILTLVSKGLSVPQAIDSVLGEGTYKRIGSEVYDELKKAKSSRPGVKAKA